jgi:hypothetical protein
MPFVFCSPLFYKNDYHHWALSAFVLNIKGQLNYGDLCF